MSSDVHAATEGAVAVARDALAAWFIGFAGVLVYAVSAAAGQEDEALPRIALVATYAAVVVSCLVAAARALRGTHAWPALIGLSIVAYSGTSIYYALGHGPAGSFPSLTDLGLFAFYPLMFAAFVGAVPRLVNHVSPTLWVDALIGSLAAACVGTALMTAVTDLEGAAAEQLFFFSGDLALLGFLVVTWALSGWRGGLALACLLAGAALLAVADGSFVLQLADGAMRPDLLSLLAWPCGVVLMAAASLGSWRSGQRVTVAWARVGVPALGGAAALCVLITQPEVVPHVLAVVVLSLVLARLVLSLLAFDRLLAKSQAAAVTDSLTGLANRHLLFDRLRQGLLRQHRSGGTVGVLFIDLDEFKSINDEHGHGVGDRVLVVVAGRLREALRSEDTLVRGSSGGRAEDVIARLGGDEFVVVLEALRSPDDAAAVAARLLSAVRAPLTFNGDDLMLDASLGIAVAASAADTRTPSALLREADTAMYAAKRGGKGQFQYFDQTMHDEVVARTQLVRDLREAVAGDQMRVLYQPQIDIATGRMTGVEALVRWEHPQQGLLAPAAFLTAAERTGLIVEIDDWVLRAACQQLRAWDDAGVAPLRMAVNVSASRLGAGAVAITVADALERFGLAAERLEIEVTETVAVESNSVAVTELTALRALGVRVAIDDFGIGHSALSRLQAFPIDRLKIDRAFISTLTDGQERGSLADAMIAIGQSLGLEVIAEGVETAEHLRALRALGCRSAQGYFFSRPVPPEHIAALTEEGSFTPDASGRTAQQTTRGEALGRDRLVRNLLSELQRLTGLESTYLTSIDWDGARQEITHAHNVGDLPIDEGLTIDWSDTVCRRALEQGINYTDEVQETFPDSEAAAKLRLQTYASVPLRGPDGQPSGTLCGASSERVSLGPEALQVMKRFAEIISNGVSRRSRLPSDQAAP